MKLTVHLCDPQGAVVKSASLELPVAPRACSWNGRVYGYEKRSDRAGQQFVYVELLTVEIPS